MDGQLRLCVYENEYILVLQCVHSGIGAGDFSGASTTNKSYIQDCGGILSIVMH